MGEREYKVNNMLIIIGIIVLISGGLYAKSKLVKSDKGIILKSDEVHTYYKSKILWGDAYADHEANDGVHNTEVVSFGDGWEYSTTTDDDGVFTVEVKANAKFKIKASDGNSWAVSSCPCGS